MIYDPITRQQVELLGRYPVQDHCIRFGKREEGTYRFVKARYGEYVNANFSGGYPLGHEKDVDIDRLVADEGSREIHKVYESLPELL